MIADIEFRWVKRKTGNALVGRFPTGSLNLVDNEESILQFRRQYRAPSTQSINQPFVDFYWGDWQDVPVVEE